MGVTVFLTVLLAIIQHPLQHIRNLAVVSSSIARRQDNNVATSRLPRIAVPSICFGWHLPVPLRLVLEVARLVFVVLRYNVRYRPSRRLVVTAVVIARNTVVESEEKQKESEHRNAQYHRSVRSR